LVSGCPEQWALQPQINLHYSATYDHNARPSQTDRQTDGRRTNIIAKPEQFVLTKPSRAKMYRFGFSLMRNIT